MRKALCKIFAFLLNLASQVIDVVVQTLLALATGVVDVLGSVVDAVGSSIMKSPVGWIVLGVGAYLLFGLVKDKEDGETKQAINSQVSV